MLHHMLRAAAQRAFQTLDPYFQYVTMLLHGDGTNGAQNNTFVDSSTNNFTITRNGNTTQGTFTPYGSNWSNASFSGSNYLTYNPGSSAAFGTGDFTVEAWVFATDALASGDNPYICDTRGGGGAWSLSWNYNGTSNPWQLAWANSSVLQSSTSMNINTWNHCAYVRSGTTGTLYLNGVSIATWTDNYNYSASVTSITIGRRNSLSTGTQYLPGYLSNFRIVKGTAVYSSSFTPSTAPLTAITNTVLLTCQSNRFIDNSSNAFTVTPTGSPSVQRFSPFSPTTAYSTSVIGGSGYFDGSGDSLGLSTQAAVPTGTQEFTFEFWVYKTGAWSSANKYIVNDTGSGGFQIWVNTGAGVVRLGRYGIAPVLDYSYSSLPTNAWVHFAYSRKGNNFALWVNGTRVATATDSNGFASSNGVQTIGGDGTSDTWDGYLANIRVVKGSYVYDTASTTITVPTAPLSAVSGTSLLLNFTNAGILDNAMMNDLETVGNAQISTSVKKYGTGSMYFDGSGDWLTTLTNPNLVLGSGDFTVECWIYTGTTGSRSGIIGNRTSSGGDAVWCIDLNPTNVGGFGYMYLHTDNSQIVSSSTNYSANTWFHLAVTRSGTTFRMFLDGTQVGSSTSSVNFSSTATMYIGAEGSRTDQSSPLNGYIDDLRITKGVARYTANFSVPTAAFPNN